MPAILETEQTANLFKLKDFEKIPKTELFRYELIDGEVFISDFSHFEHQLLISKLIGSFGYFVQQNSLGNFLSAMDCIFDEFNLLIPDLVFVSNKRLKKILDKNKDKFIGAPELVIEILSPGKANLRRDKILKFQTYERFGVQEYWIVNPQKSNVEIYRREEDEFKPAQICGENDEISTPLLPNFSFAVSALFAN